jgi:predicted nucleic acid-binding protein
VSKRITRIVGIDSMIPIYAGLVPSKNKESKELTALCRRARILFHELQDHTVILPTVAISEILIPVPAIKRGQVLATLAELFVCPPFDQRAASIAADIWSKHRSIPDNLQYDNRQMLRADAMIVASAKAAGATEFYTNDDKCRALAELVMSGRRLPKQSEKLFIDEELELDETEGPAPKKRKPAKKKKP